MGKTSPVAGPSNKLPTTPARSRPAPPHARMTTPDGNCRVRMYRQGLGDCFLIAFPTKDADEPFYLMIDCGVVLGTEKPAEIMKTVAADIREATNKRIDVLVATHQHWDHLSGFLQAPDAFREIKVKQLWLAWTEDPADKLAQSLRAQRRKVKKALQQAVTKLERSPGLREQVQGLTDFFGLGANAATADLAAAGLNAASSARSADTESALDFLRDHAEQTRFFRPGQDPVPLEGVTGGARVFVLGPPHDQDKLFHSNPSAKERQGNVVYSLAQTPGADASFLAAAVDAKSLAEDADFEELRASELSRPFDACHHIYATSVDDTGRRPATDPLTVRAGCRASREEREFFQSHYYGKQAGRAEDAAWRRIDGDWLEVAAELALKLDNDTNNTSLAFAVELPNQNVLLFPADAQVGNWKSWQDYTWDGGGGKKVTANDLLARTVFYKVGHHGSHNATLREGGLEKMGRDLVAMLPVDQAMASKKRWNHMPLEGLVTALRERTGGRLLRLDIGEPNDSDRQPSVSLKAWKEFRKATSTSNHLYLEYTCPCG